MFKLKNVTKIYSQGEQSVTALSDLELEIGQVGFISVVGESGSGKTTLLNLLAGFDKYNRGEIYFDDRQMSVFTEEEWNSYYGQDVGFVFQEYNVIEEFTVWENVELPLKILDISNEKKQKIIESALKLVGLENIKDKIVNKLSGGQKQRVAIARAYVKVPKVIFADEPTGNLDYDNSIKVFEMLKDISKHILVIVVTHNNALAKEYSDRIIRLSDGVIEMDSVFSKENYKIILTCANQEKEVLDIQDIIEFIKKNPTDDMEYSLKAISIEEKSSSKKKTEIQRERYNKREISIKEIIGLSKKILSKRWIRYLLSMGIFALTNFLMLLFIDFAFYNEDKVVAEYLERYREDHIIVERQLDILTGNEEDGNIAYVTKEIKEDLIDMSGDSYFCMFEKMGFTNDDHMMNFDEEDEEKETFDVYADSYVLSDYILKSKYNIYDLQGNEIVISKSVAKEAGLTKDDVGKKYFLDEAEIILKDIVDIDKDIMLLSTRYIEYVKECNKSAYISVEGNFLTPESLFKYANSNVSISNIKYGEYTELIGDVPKGDKEVILSYSFLHENLKAEEYSKYIGKNYYLKDLYQDKYGNSMSEKMNLYDYLGNKITVVGIADFDGDVYVTDTVYNTIADDYYSVYIYNKLGCYGSEWDSVIEALHEHNFRVSDNNLDNVYMIVDMKPVLLKYIVLILIIMVTLTLFLMVSLISYSIKDNSKVIGIMKAIGIDKVTIKKVFAIEPIKVILITFAVALVALFGIVGFINGEYAAFVTGRAYDILPVSPLAILTTGIFVFIIGVVTVLFPLKEMDRKTIVESIRY